MGDGTPKRRWELSAPESGVLLWGPETRSGEALKLAFLELVVRRALRLVSVEHRRFYVFPAFATVLAPGNRLEQSTSRPLRAVIDASPEVRAYADGTVGTPVDQWARAVFGRYQRSGGYVKFAVLPALEERGYYRREQYKRLGLFDASRWLLTPDGMAALAELKSLLEMGRELFGNHTERFGGQWVPADPAVLQAFTQTAGASLLLLPDLFAEIRQALARVASGENRGELVMAHYDIDNDAGQPSADEGLQEHETAGVEALDLDTLAGHLGPGPFDGLDAAFDAIDTGVDSGGGDASGGGE